MFAAAMVALGSSLLSSMSQNKQVKAQNRITASQNKQQLLSAANDASALNIQAGQLAQDATQKRAEAVRMASQASGEQGAMAGATGTQGASVDAVQSDIQMQLGQQEDQINENLQNQLASIQMQRGQAYAQAGSRMQSATSAVSPMQTATQWGTSLLGMYAGGALQFGSFRDNSATDYRSSSNPSSTVNYNSSIANTLLGSR